LTLIGSRYAVVGHRGIYSSNDHLAYHDRVACLHRHLILSIRRSPVRSYHMRSLYKPSPRLLGTFNNSLSLAASRFCAVRIVLGDTGGQAFATPSTLRAVRGLHRSLLLQLSVKVDRASFDSRSLADRCRPGNIAISPRFSERLRECMQVWFDYLLHHRGGELETKYPLRRDCR
jgi:hypothetical protein